MTVAIAFDPILANAVAGSYHNLVACLCTRAVAMWRSGNQLRMFHTLMQSILTRSSPNCSLRKGSTWNESMSVPLFSMEPMHSQPFVLANAK
jgi:hypothetical protein